jgi:hypothetical protein
MSMEQIPCGLSIAKRRGNQNEMMKTVGWKSLVTGYGRCANGLSGNVHSLRFSIKAYFADRASLRSCKQALQIVKQ